MLLTLLKNMQFKKDPRLIVFAIVLVGVTAGLIAHKDITVKEGLAFLSGALALPGLFGASKNDTDDGDDDPPPKIPNVLPQSAPPTGSTSGLLSRMRVLVLVGVVLVFSLVGCSVFTKKNAKNALDAASITCIFATELTNESVVADVCGIARELIPIVRNLIGQREGAKRSGVRWPGAVDAGAVEAGAE